eukprot:m.67473 g.67473  ORF g.67473 m.67473 type:complete len:503 (-) comp7682_c0_seq2:947-2455(-)
MLRGSAAAVLVLAVLAACGSATIDPAIEIPSGYKVFRQSNRSTLYTATLSSDAVYGTPVYVADLHGSRYEMGYDYGKMLAHELSEVYDVFLKSLIGSEWYEPEVAALVGAALDWQWRDFLSAQVPSEYLEELQGLQAGGAAAGVHNVGKMIERVIVLANAPGDLKDFIFVLLREFNPSAADRLAKRKPAQEPFRGFCSMFAVWGSRTQDAKLFSGRNLDWERDTGMNKYKVLTVFHPPGKIAHATMGFIPVWGALAGMSEAGLTVHEANLEENEITFSGFPWILRLRYIMENAKSTADAKSLWVATNNTVGFNHMVASASDAAAYAKTKTASPGVAIAMETMYEYTAFFTDNDPREASATYKHNSTATPVHIGAPMPEAVWRTNHGYDPTIRKHFEWSQNPDSWSNQRYFFIHDSLKTFETSKNRIGLKEAAIIVAVVGDKGKHAHTCENNTDGSNVLSVAFAPTDMTVAVAWESNTGDTWRPACCSTYVQFDMKYWFGTSR